MREEWHAVGKGALELPSDSILARHNGLLELPAAGGAQHGGPPAVAGGRKELAEEPPNHGEDEGGDVGIEEDADELIRDADGLRGCRERAVCGGGGQRETEG